MSALPSFATLPELEAITDCPDPQQADHVLWSVSTRIRREAGQSFVDDDGALITMPALAADLLRSVTLEAARRRLVNPEGATSRSETLGPFSTSTTVSADNVYLTKQERADIAEAVRLAYPSDGGFTGLGTISTTRGVLETAPMCSEPDWDDWAAPPVGWAPPA